MTLPWKGDILIVGKNFLVLPFISAAISKEINNRCETSDYPQRPNRTVKTMPRLDICTMLPLF
jgi:hypothetical protein